MATHLRMPEEMAAYLDACIVESDGDSSFIAKARGDTARAYRALSGARSPDFATILKVARALGVQLHASAA